MDHFEPGLGPNSVPVKLKITERCNHFALYRLPGLSSLSKPQVLSWQLGAPYARVLRMSKCFSPNLAWALKPSLSNMATVPNHRDHDPPSLEVSGYPSTIPPPCFWIESSAAFNATFATPFFLKSLSTKKQVRRQSFGPRSSDRSSFCSCGQNRFGAIPSLDHTGTIQ